MSDRTHSMEAANRRMNEIKPLTSLRAIAAFLVFMFHYAYLMPAERAVGEVREWIPLMPIWKQGQIGVSIFFVLSGFLITRLYFAPLVERRVSLREYFIKRIARIWPLFVLLAVIQHVALWLSGARPDATWWVTLSMSQGFFQDLYNRGLPTAWSLSVEESFYAFAPLLFLAIAAWAWRPLDAPLGRARLARLGVLLAIFAAVFAALGEAMTRLVSGTALGWEGFMGGRDHWMHSTLFGRFPEFAVGAIGAFIHRDPRFASWMTPRRGLWLSLLCFAGIAVCLMLKNQMTRPASWFMIEAVVLLSGVLILALCAPRNVVHRLLSTRIAVFAGKISYALYLIQLTVLMAPLVWATDRLGPARVPVLYLLTSLVCAALYRFYETPVRLAIVAASGGRASAAARPERRRA